jgi:periplasmic divalent cation tolerance protein
MKSEEILTVYMTFADAAQAEWIGHLLVEEKLLACINIMPGVTSIYPWDGAIQTSSEVAAFGKTTAGAWDKLLARVIELHSYDCPCVVAWPLAHVAPAYASWLRENIT